MLLLTLSDRKEQDTLLDEQSEEALEIINIVEIINEKAQR